MHGPAFDQTFQRQLRELFEWRRDVRHFRSDPLPPGRLEELIEIACLAPSVGLSQPWRFVIVDDPQRRADVRANFTASNAAALAAYAEERASRYARLKLAGLDSAPHQLAVFADHSTSKGHGLGRATMPKTIEYSVVAAITVLMLAARAAGIGVGWISILDPIALVAALGLPKSWHFVGYVCLGYAVADDTVPMLEREDWETRSSYSDFIFRR